MLFRMLNTYSDRILFFFLVATLLWLPIYRGGNVSGPIALLIISAVFIFLLSLFSSNHKPIAPWLLVWVAITTSLILQILTPLVAYSDVISIGVYRIELNTLYIWSVFSSMWLICWRVSLLDSSKLEWLLMTVLIASVFQALFGLFHFLSESESVLGLWNKQYYLNDATGTFINRNHFAGMLAMCWPMVVSAIIAKRPILFGKLKASSRAAIALLYSVIILAALLTSHSRMGTAAAFLGLVTWSVIFFKHRSNERGKFSQLLPFTGLVLLLLFAVWFGVEDIALRYATLENGDSRLDVWRAMFDLSWFAWLVGIGPGSFEDVFHLVQPSGQTVRFVYAHNDYLEFVLEFGLIFALVIASAFIYLVYKALPRGDYAQRAGALGALAAIALHSTVDFNLQIPGSALFAWVALGLVMNPNMAVSRKAASAATEGGLTRADVAVKRRFRHSSRKAKRSFPKTKQEWFAFFRSN
jgi:putative inorganic carbon (HCO3(-)) transporter